MRLLMLTVALGLAGCVETPRQTEARLKAETRTDARLDRELAGLVAGPPQACIGAQDRREMNGYGEMLVFRGAGGVRYVTQTNGCRDVGEGNILVTRTPTTQLCRGDIATTIDSASRVQTGACSFGDFIPYRRPN
jgi:hypothetical protein